MKDVLVLILIVAISLFLLRQVRKPMWFPGRLFLWIMNLNHSSLTNWGLEHVLIRKDYTVLDVGCGGGRTIQKLAAVATEGKVCGVDYSATSVASSKRKNKVSIDDGRVEIQQASVSQLPFSDRMFDLVTAVETHYYWPDLRSDFREVLRVLKPGGKLVVIAEAYKGGKFDLPSGLIMRTLKAAYLGPKEFRALLTSSGYENVEVFEDSRKGWICSVASRPS